MSEIDQLLISIDQVSHVRHAEMQSRLLSLVRGSSILENIVQFGSAALVILEHTFYLWHQERRRSPFHVALQHFMISPNAGSLGDALSIVVDAYQANFKSDFVNTILHRARTKQMKMELINTIIQITLQHRLPIPSS
ncbi:hypothetical protein K503DRAFT_770508 [Rhizopogon vinicolor AM-OR11-026]|uniref:Uncharacterized protein n=1 Tax=Rhizopogon vinicolor AM-OR11-026 TaxID=1314800 RepID=A0A1B7N0M1_9AGAM|nr:hypothetical protein K503DRAFT_770508 [Rhizopogon vinicolor AM-OR11-026]